MSKVLCDYPDSFAERIRKNGRIIYDNFSHFSEKNQKASIYSRLSKSDYPYVFYAFNRFPNKQVADICHISERTVAKRYNDIYNKLGINNKQELVKAIDVAFGDE